MHQEATDLLQLHTLLFSPQLISAVWHGHRWAVMCLLPCCCRAVYLLCGGSCNCLSLGSASSQQDNPVRGRLRATFCARGGGMGGLRHGGLQAPVCCYCCLMPHFNQRLMHHQPPCTPSAQAAHIQLLLQGHCVHFTLHRSAQKEFVLERRGAQLRFKSLWKFIDHSVTFFSLDPVIDQSPLNARMWYNCSAATVVVSCSSCHFFPPPSHSFVE